MVSVLLIKSPGEIVLSKDMLSIKAGRFVPMFVDKECCICDENSLLVRWPEKDKVDRVPFIPSQGLTINMVNQFTSLILSDAEVQEVTVNMHEQCRLEVIGCPMLHTLTIRHRGTDFEAVLYNDYRGKYKGQTLRRGVLGVHRHATRGTPHDKHPILFTPGK